ncbi:response regulator [Robiginitalea sp. SC105]|uniref:response regulator n=1 Tax=Robiginitalea sp. SC105 TaxID=2762332 RepID=UPI00163A6E4B|nr:response regulator [Robiginitalea sp. SC105]MBC2839567.1 response regulator [Robiginitalea sp. SC105]
MKRILIIEDNEDVRENTADLLQLAGYDTATSADGHSGISLALEYKPHLILCDIMMPGMDGYQVLEHLQSHAQLAGTPFVFLTAKSEKSDIRKGMNLGADDYLTKPFEESELLGAVESRLYKHAFLQKKFHPGMEGMQQFMKQASSYLNLDHIERTYFARKYNPKEYLFMEGDGVHHLFYIRKGTIKAHKSTEAGKELVTGIFREGQFIGQLSMLNPGGTYLETATVVDPAEVYPIPKSDFIHLLDSDREVAHKFMELISGDLIDLQRQLLQMAYWPVKQRVARALIKLREGLPTDAKTDTGIEISREDLAGIVGTATETTIRALTELKTEGLIRMGKARSIIISDPENLKKLARAGC